MQALPLHIPLLFGLTTITSLLLFHWVVRNSSYHTKANTITAALVVWIILQSLISKSGFYATNLESLPPRFIFIVVPVAIFLSLLFFSEKIRLSRTFLLAWNFITLGLLVFIIINAVLSSPTPLHQFAFEQPNIALLHFPYILLPAFIVPLVLFGHFASIRRLK